MNLKEQLIIIDGKNVTKDIIFYKFNNEKNLLEVRYKNNNKLYKYSNVRFKLLQNPNILNIEKYSFYVNNKLLKNIKEMYEFKDSNYSYYYAIFDDYFDKYFDNNELKKINNEYNDVIKYLTEVSKITSLDTEDGKKILYEQMKKIEIEDLDTALSNYLKLSEDLSKKNDIETLIFPFGCNSSQYEAVENAIYNKISVIEGPPGTGKTQTILNIISNVIIRNMNCQVVSNNNTAIENIDNKLKSYELNFFEALLGRRKNKELFIENQNVVIPKFEEYENIDINEIALKIKNNHQLVKKIYNTKKEIAKLIQQRNELQLEYKYFKELVISQNINLVNLKKYNQKKVKVLWNEILCLKKLSFLNKLKYIYVYKIGDYNFYKNDLNFIIKNIQNLDYIKNLNELDLLIKDKESFVDNNKDVEKEFINLSMDYLKKYLSLKYKNRRKVYSSNEIWKNSEEFLNDYPVILSTTYSSKNNFNNNFKFDYIIMDESSQIDVVTGTLALSTAKYAVIIGDEKQLPNVVPNDIAKKTKIIFNEYNLDKSYSYELNSFLLSIKNTIPNIQNKMLVEHYRCHPKIINFCNKKFYNNNLVIMTEDAGETDAIKIIKTNKGKHERDKTSQRQVDIIKEILSQVKGDVGVIAPYNNQVELIKEYFSKLDIEVNTVHKFQGREKDTIIISTVDDEIGEFVGDEKILNVAISRAKKHLYFIVTGNDIKNTNINDFINYVDYNNMEIINSKIYSSFDLLYKQYELERLEFFKKHNRISKYDSENIIYNIINNVVKDYDNLSFHFHQSLNDLIKDKSLLNIEEKRYASHHNTHIDFYIFNKMGDRPVLAIEVDGYKYHKKGTKQYERDLLKDNILSKYNIPLLRLKTNGSEEENKIKEMLDKVLK